MTFVNVELELFDHHPDNFLNADACVVVRQAMPGGGVNKNLGPRNTAVILQMLEYVKRSNECERVQVRFVFDPALWGEIERIHAFLDQVEWVVCLPATKM